MKTDKAGLVHYLRTMATLIEAEDSFEGRIEYTCMDDDLELNEFHVNGFYRFGNSLGQGGIKVLQ